MKDRRKYPRVDATSVIWYEIKDYEKLQSHDDDVAIETPIKTVDISLGGIKIIHSKQIPKDKLLKIIISLPGTQEPIVILAKVVWTREIEKHTYAIGMEFKEFLNNKKNLLEKYITQLL